MYSNFYLQNILYYLIRISCSLLINLPTKFKFKLNKIFMFLINCKFLNKKNQFSQLKEMCF